MGSPNENMEREVRRLLEVLDVDIRHLQFSLSLLDRLRGCVISRDEAGLENLLKEIQDEAGAYAGNEALRESLRRDMAAMLGCEVESLTLSRLQGEVPPALEEEVASRRSTLRSLASELSREYAGTSALLSDCARFNGRLLRSILEFGRTETTTYSSSGSATRHTESALMDLQL